MSIVSNTTMPFTTATYPNYNPDPGVLIKQSEYEEYVYMKSNPTGIQKIIFNDPVTVVFWNDGTKTTVRNMDGTPFNPYQGFCAAVAKKVVGGNHNHKVKKVIKELGNLDYDQWEESRRLEREEVVEQEPKSETAILLEEAAKGFIAVLLDAIKGDTE